MADKTIPKPCAIFMAFVSPSDGTWRTEDLRAAGRCKGLKDVSNRPPCDAPQGFSAGVVTRPDYWAHLPRSGARSARGGRARPCDDGAAPRFWCRLCMRPTRAQSIT